MSINSGSTRRDRNREAVRKFRKKEREEDREIESLYRSNEEKIARLEKLAEQLSAELKDDQTTVISTVSVTNLKFDIDHAIPQCRSVPNLRVRSINPLRV